MTLASARARAGFTALFVLWATAASGQTLADMAKRAEEQRKAADGKSRRIEMFPEHEMRTLPINKPEVEHYVNLRAAIARLWHLDHALFERVRSGSLLARSLTEWCRVLDAEPEIAKTLTRYNYSCQGLMEMSTSIEQAERLAEGGFDMNSLTPVQRENYYFAGRNKVWLSLMRGRIHKAEAGLTIWR